MEEAQDYIINLLLPGSPIPNRIMPHTDEKSLKDKKVLPAWPQEWIRILIVLQEPALLRNTKIANQASESPMKDSL
jgi:hypothetical protein